MELANWRRFTRHPLSAAWPDMSEVEFESLLADMKQHGYDQKQQVVLFEGQVLDGWHRQRCGVMLDKTPTYDVFKGTEEQAELLVIRRNLNRRHLDTSQRGLMAGRFATMKHGGDRRGQDAKLHLAETHKTLEKSAEEFKVSERTAAAGKKVAENGSKELQDAVMEKVVALSDAAVIAKEPKPVQNKAVRDVRSGKAKTVKAATEEKPAEEKEVPKVDCNGVLIPEQALAAFETATHIGSVCKYLDTNIRLIGELGKMKGGECLHTDSIIQTLRKVRKALWASRATNVCPYCQGRKKTCNACKGDGWVDPTTYSQAPKEMKQ